MFPRLFKKHQFRLILRKEAASKSAKNTFLKKSLQYFLLKESSSAFPAVSRRGCGEPYRQPATKKGASKSSFLYWYLKILCLCGGAAKIKRRQTRLVATFQVDHTMGGFIFLQVVLKGQKQPFGMFRSKNNA